MMEQNTTNKPLRRVGTLTLGVCLIAAGTLFLLPGCTQAASREADIELRLCLNSAASLVGR